MPFSVDEAAEFIRDSVRQNMPVNPRVMQWGHVTLYMEGDEDVARFEWELTGHTAFVRRRSERATRFPRGNNLSFGVLTGSHFATTVGPDIGMQSGSRFGVPLTKYTKAVFPSSKESYHNVRADHYVTRELQEVFNHNFVYSRVREMDSELKALMMSAERQLRRRLMRSYPLREEYLLAVKIFGEQPNTNHVALVRAAKNAIVPLMDTPALVRIALLWHQRDILKRIKRNTATAAWERLRSATPASLTRVARAEYKDLQPRHWRWLIKRKPTFARKWLSDPRDVRLRADYFPPGKKYDPLFTNLRHYVPDVPGELPEIVDVFLSAVKKYVESPKQQDERHPWHTPLGMQRVIRSLLAHEADIVIDGDVKRASLARLYAITQDLAPVAPPESMEYGAFTVTFPDGFTSVEVNGFTFEALRTHVDVYEHGRLMRHCLFRHSPYMKEGTHVAYAVKENGRSVGTFLVRTYRGRTTGQRFSLIQLVGHVNAYVTPDSPISRAAENFLQKLNDEVPRDWS